VARLIHLNGPPGIGKSTLAQRYVDEHPGVLNLDIDRVRALIGGWQERFTETGEIVRPLALSMAAAHLSGGRDLIMPQYLSRLSAIERFEAVAHDSGAAFCEVVLMDGKKESLERFYRRGENGELPWHQQVQQIVERDGGQELLDRMYDQLITTLAARPDATILPSIEGNVQQTYEALTAILDRKPLNQV
jgi:predicted kinase